MLEMSKEIKTAVKPKLVRRRRSQLSERLRHQKIVELCVSCLLQAQEERQIKTLERLFCLLAPSDYLSWLQLQPYLPSRQEDKSQER